MDKRKLIISMLPVMAIIMIPQTFALESDNTYFLDDSEFISILIEVDSQGTPSFEEVFITPEGDKGEFIMDADTIVRERISSDHMTGQLIGKTLEGDVVLVKFLINGDDVHLFAKVWTDNGIERISSDGEVISIF